MIRNTGVIALCALLLIAPVLCTGQVAARPPVKDPGGGSGSYFWGNAYGLDESGDMHALVGAKVTAIYYFFNYYGNRFFCEGDYTYTDSDGYYTLWLSHDDYPYITPDWDDGVYVKIEKGGYWTEWKVFYKYSGYTWRCSEDLTEYVPKFLSYSNTDDAEFEFTSTVSVEVTVAAYVAGSGASLTVRGTWAEGYGSPAGQLQVFEKVKSTGIYHYDTKTKQYVVDNAWLYDAGLGELVGGSVYGLDDPMGPPSDVAPFELEPGKYKTQTVNIYSEGSVKLGVKISVGVSVAIVSASVELETYVEVTLSSSLDFMWKVTNNDIENNHTYKSWFEADMDLGLIMHIWQIS